MSAQETQADPRSPAGEWTFTFGVSGHRDPLDDDSAELQKQIRTVFDRFRLAHPNASFELLSPLADGADRIAAEVALRAGLRIVVPLPMTQAEYERDFTSTESLHEFRRLLATAASVFEVSSDNVSTRADKYAAVGDYIARRSNVLILLWDGKDNSKTGGTAWVKKRREYWINLSKTTGNAPAPFGFMGTIQIVTPRRAGRGHRPKIEIIGDLPQLPQT
ncbi:MAG: hypothetical protein ABR611_07460 [Chthoniobacterales bacterium]